MRLTKQDWLEEARRRLGTEGIAGINIEKMARSLKVSKGSFYWHFKDRKALLWSLLDYWEENTKALIVQAEQETAPGDKLARLFAEIGAMGITGETGLYSWAAQEPEVQARVEKVEKQRVGYLEQLFVESGFSLEEAAQRAKLTYLAFVGYLYRVDTDMTLDLEELGQSLLSLLIKPATSSLNAQEKKENKA